MISIGPDLSNPYPHLRMTDQPESSALFKNASREFLYAWAAGVEMESKIEQTPDGSLRFTMTTVPLVGIVDLGDGRITVFTRPRSTCTKTSKITTPA